MERDTYVCIYTNMYIYTFVLYFCCILSKLQIVTSKGNACAKRRWGQMAKTNAPPHAVKARLGRDGAAVEAEVSTLGNSLFPKKGINSNANKMDI